MSRTILSKIKRAFVGYNQDFLMEYIPENGVCAEIGVWKGDFTSRLLKGSNVGKLHLIDPWKHFPEFDKAMFGGMIGSQQGMDDIHDAVRDRFRKEITADRVVVNRDLSEQAAEQFDNEYFDWIYIDGNHTYDFVKRDLEKFYPKVKRNGYITGDDYQDDNWWGDGVKKAVDEFVENHDVELLTIKNNQFALLKK